MATCIVQGVNSNGKPSSELHEGAGERLVRLRQLPPVAQHEMVQEHRHLQLRQLRPSAQPRPASVWHEAVRRRRRRRRVVTLQKTKSECSHAST
ncbi:hypothetical protein BHE74_00024826 [Ensete ventricosum]|nr:hypothetical protein GW17_00028202 [Ensete ventricosum]RWW67706.1 hypothetical protein BHE74_00024826 [Ensete ventricosum]